MEVALELQTGIVRPTWGAGRAILWAAKVSLVSNGRDTGTMEHTEAMPWHPWPPVDHAGRLGTSQEANRKKSPTTVH